MEIWMLEMNGTRFRASAGVESNVSPSNLVHLSYFLTWRTRYEDQNDIRDEEFWRNVNSVEKCP